MKWLLERNSLYDTTLAKTVFQCTAILFYQTLLSQVQIDKCKFTSNTSKAQYASNVDL
jgi:putative component of membrane protein insertase Oxa1/YidC/SpoIIIJ protein YidD